MNKQLSDIYIAITTCYKSTSTTQVPRFGTPYGAMDQGPTAGVTVPNRYR
jgi:hypothetical protein